MAKERKTKKIDGKVYKRVKHPNCDGCAFQSVHKVTCLLPDEYADDDDCVNEGIIYKRY